MTPYDSAAKRLVLKRKGCLREAARLRCKGALSKMKVTKKKADGDVVRFECVATAEEVANALHGAQVAFANSMGLRPEKDKTVAQVAEERMGIKDLDSIVESDAIEALIPLALDKKNIIPSFPPKAEPASAFKRGSEFRFALDVTMKPEYELTSYEPVEITVPPFSINEAAVDAQLEEIANRYTVYEKAPDKPVEKGDSCLISLEASENGKPLPGLTTEGRTYTAGLGYMPAGFEEQVIGMRPGETKEFTFEGPGFDDDFNECTQKVDCKVTVKEIQREVKPEIDDAWVKQNMPMMGDAAALRADIAKSIERRDRADYENYKLQMVASELGRRFQGSIADEVYETMRDSMISNIRMELKQQGKTWEEFVNDNGGEQQFGIMMMMQVREVLVQGFALDAVFRHEKLTLTDEDILDACAAMNPGADPRQTRQQFEQSGRGFALRESAERMKANRWALERATIHTPEEMQGTAAAVEEAVEKSIAEEADATAREALGDE